MRSICTLVAIVLISSANALSAQTGSTPGMGATSPLGSDAETGTSMSNIQANIPMGATELDPSGISPLAMPCPTMSATGSFDGGGVATSTVCGSASTTTDSSGMGVATSGLSGSDASATGAGVTASSSAGVPLGATGLGTPGESQGAAISTPPVAPCTSTQGLSGPIGTALPGSC
jgi:hypothetical protein